MSPSQRRQVVNVDRGLFLVRYASAEDTSAPPTIAFAASPGSRDDLHFLLHPDESEPVLRAPGTALVLRADLPGRIAMDIVPVQADGSVAATVRFEPLSQSFEKAPVPSGETPTASCNTSLAVMGHVASRGDVVTESGVWMAGPTAPARIEGFAIDWPSKPPGVDLRYRVTTAQTRGAENEWARSGVFVGSRGRALPIVGLEIELTGPAASTYRCDADLLFLGSPVARFSGQRIRSAGPTGREPLVGLRIALSGATPERRLTPERPRSAPAFDQIKIFRGEASGQRLPA